MIAVIGAGITGLAAAFELRRLDASSDVTVLEAADRPGGKILTTAFAGRPVDAGADAFLARVPSGVELCRQLGLADRLVAPARRTAYVLVDGALRPLPAEQVLGVPLDVEAAAASRILTTPPISRPGPRLAPGDDRSIGAVIRERLGDEVADRLVGPLIGGINAGDIDRLSIRAVTPRLAAGAEAGEDLIAALRSPGADQAPEPGAPVFLTLPGGLADLVDALAGPELRLGTPALEIAEAPAGGWLVETAAGTVEAEAVVVSTPAFVAAELVAPIAPAAATLLAEVDHASVVMVTFAFDPADIARPLDASGFLVPPAEGRLMTACSWASSKWAHLAGGPAILRVSAGRDGDQRAMDLDDSDLVKALLDDLDATMGLTGAPLQVRVTRWPRSFPQYRPGHLDRVTAVEAHLAARAPGVTVAGAGLRGLGIPACIEQGRRAARAAVASRSIP